MATGCINGDVKLEDDDTPNIYWNGVWYPICGHGFWKNKIGVQKFCDRLGYQDGNLSPAKSTTYGRDAFRVGKCKESDKWLRSCTGGCNDYKVGGRCSDVWTHKCGKEAHVAFAISCFSPRSSFLRSSCIGKKIFTSSLQSK